MDYKIIDIGGSFLKIYSSKNKEIIQVPMFNEKIIKLQDLKNLINNHIDKDIDFIGLSSQMHGFVLFDENNINISEFITWKNNSNINIFDNNNFNEFYKTGLKNRTDLPINNLYQYIENNNICNTKIYFKNITEAILDIKLNKTHSTMACGSGFYNIEQDIYIQEYIDYFKIKYNITLLFDDVIKTKQISGYINNIPVYAGIGDFQASIYGLNLEKYNLIINMATGSQIGCIIEKNEIKNDIFNYRPYFNNLYIKCITHIPSGRLLNIFDNFLSELNFDIWEYIKTISIDDIYNSTLNIDTNIFSKNGISISNIFENKLTLKNLISSLIYNYVKQYINIIRDNNLNFEYIILSGGIVKKISIIKLIIEKELNIKTIINNYDDDSIKGVLRYINE
jgi:sugar (pentulose or hexulose) kinase